MEKLELKGNILYKITKEKVDSLDVERELATLQKELNEITERLEVLKSYKVIKDGQIQADGGATIKEK